MGCCSSRDASSPRNVSNSNIIGGSYSNHYSYNNNENNYSSNVKINYDYKYKKSEEKKIDSSTYKFSSNYSIKQKLLASKDIHIPIIKDLEELHKIKTTTEHKLTPELKNEVFGEGTNGFKEHYENPEIDSDVMNTAVKESSWRAKFKETLYYKWFSCTKREGNDLLEAVKDILVLAPLNKTTFMKFYDEFKDEPANVVTLMWSYEPKHKGEIKIYKLINMALIIDAKNIFEDEMKGNIKFAKDFLKDYGINDIDRVLQYSIKFIRILNTALVDEGFKYNTCKRVTYRGVCVDIFKNVEEGEIYRVITWSCSSESKDIAEYFRTMSTNPGSMITFNIPKGCMNAGKINEFGMSWIPSELETLIPPYTSIKMLKESVESSVKHYEVKVARDNKYVNYDSDHSAEFDVESDVSDKAQYEPSDQSEHEDNNLHQNKINPLPQNIATNHNQIEDIEENVGIEENDQNIEHINNITNNSKEHDLNENIDLNINFNISNGPAENTMQDQIQDQTQDPNTTRPSDLKSNKKSKFKEYYRHTAHPGDKVKLYSIL